MTVKDLIKFVESKIKEADEKRRRAELECNYHGIGGPASVSCALSEVLNKLKEIDRS